MNIDYDLENNPLEIETNSVVGSEDQIKVWFVSDHKFAAGFNIKFSSTPSYLVKECTLRWADFPNSLPTETVKVWRMTLSRTSGIRLAIHSNDVEVLNVQISGTTCEDVDWSSVWSSKVDKIRFQGDDTASNYYRSYQLQQGKDFLGNLDTAGDG